MYASVAPCKGKRIEDPDSLVRVVQGVVMLPCTQLVGQGMPGSYARVKAEEEHKSSYVKARRRASADAACTLVSGTTFTVTWLHWAPVCQCFKSPTLTGLVDHCGTAAIQSVRARSLALLDPTDVTPLAACKRLLNHVLYLPLWTMQP